MNSSKLKVPNRVEERRLKRQKNNNNLRDKDNLIIILETILRNIIICWVCRYGILRTRRLRKLKGKGNRKNKNLMPSKAKV